MKTYKQLSQAQRYQIEILKKGGKEPERDSGIARCVRCHLSPGVEAESRQERLPPETGADQSGQAPDTGGQSPEMTEDVVLLIEEKILLDWSPEQISGWLKVERGIAISHERIYQHI